MYAPQYPTKGQPPTGPTPHIHSTDTTLTDHENEQTFKTYLTGRKLVYLSIIDDIKTKIEIIQETQQRNPNDSALWALTEGQIEGLKEILNTLKKAKDAL